MIKAIIFDWGRALWDNDLGKLDDSALDVLNYCAEKYKLALVSIATRETPEARRKVIADLGFEKYFTDIEIVGADQVKDEGKDRLLEKIAKKLGAAYLEIAVVGDRMFREIQWGNKHGCMTIWLQKGKFAEELPTEETGQPRHIIHELRELLSIL